jgi:hypothetical protein
MCCKRLAKLPVKNFEDWECERQNQPQIITFPKQVAGFCRQMWFRSSDIPILRMRSLGYGEKSGGASASGITFGRAA